MVAYFRSSAGSGYDLQVLGEDRSRIICRGWREDADGHRTAVLAVLPVGEKSALLSVDREYELRDALDDAWAVRPFELVREQGRTMLVLQDPGGEPLDGILGTPMEMGVFLRLAVGIAGALKKVHDSGLIHKDIKPANILVDTMSNSVRLTGFGIASRLPRERQAPGAPELLAGTLAYMAPEQTGRMNRSIDPRSDLYACGVTFYEMLVGALPFSAADPIEWIHCHIARQPSPPSAHRKRIADPLSALVMKLLAKAPEDRYQTAAGLLSDLSHCSAEWESHRRIQPFRLGMRDVPDRLMIPESLYGREREIGLLLASFDRVMASGRTQLVLVSGYSGIGKSSVVNELHKALVPPRGLFASGKFDQYKSDIPYATLGQAFRGLVGPLLGRPDAELDGWREVLREALGQNGQLIIHLVPELELVLGEQPTVPDLPPQDAKNRFQMVFRRFLDVFACKEHPLALFLDDLQWLDVATLDLLEHLVTHAGERRLLLIGAYRDNEVGPSHPLASMLRRIKRGGAQVQEVRLAPLRRDALGRLIADAVNCEAARADPLARLVHEKTGGNPFFAIQFILSLVEEGLLFFDRDAPGWCWQLDHVHARGHTDNVVDLMVEKMARLPAKTQAAMRRLACFGNFAEISTFCLISETPEETAATDFRDAIRAELVERLDGSYKFIHDRVQEAAYSLIPETLRAASHLRIGRLLAAQTSPEKQDEAVFEIVNQLNRGSALIMAEEEREQLAELNLRAGQRAKATTAYAAALAYLVAGSSLLAESAWETRHELAFALEWHRAESEFLTGATMVASERLSRLASRAVNTVERARVACLHIDLFAALNQPDHSVAICLAYLRHLGVEWVSHPTDGEARQYYERLWSRLQGRAIEELADQPLMSDPASRATLDVLTTVVAPALWTDQNLLSLVLCSAAELSLTQGNSDGSCFTYVWLGALAGQRYDDYQAGLEFGRLGFELVETRGLKRFQCRTGMVFASHILSWAEHILASRDLLRNAYRMAIDSGDLTFAVYSCDQLNTNLLAAGDPLGDAQQEVEYGLEFAKKAQVGAIVDVIVAQLGLIRTLRGLTLEFGSFNDGEFDELEFERHLIGKPLAMPECRYWIRKLQARLFAGHYALALDASRKARQLIWTSIAAFETAEYHLYAALSHAASYDGAPLAERQDHLEALLVHHRQLAVWAEYCPATFLNRATLVAAELARIDGRDMEAMRLYEQAIDSARANGFVHNEALTAEFASRFYMARGFKKIAYVYLRDARQCYLRWGAAGKVRQLDGMYPDLAEEAPTRDATATIVAPLDYLDLATIIKVSQAVSSEIVAEKLIDTLMRAVVHHAGAERGLLILMQGTGERLEAEAKTSGDTVVVTLPGAPLAESALPKSIVHYVARTRSITILNDALTLGQFSGDLYFRDHHVRSVLCLPLVKQGLLIGILYLENRLAPDVFTPHRVAVLELLAAQAAISLENTRLYGDLKEREGKIRRLVDANIVGICLWNSTGEITEANEAFLQMTQYLREDLSSGHVRWADLTPPEWLEHDEQAVIALRTTGTVHPFEKELFRKNGGRVSVLLGAAAFDGGQNEGVAFIVDLTDRNRAEQAAHDSERRYHELQMELAHANRIASVGLLSASIAHEISQPLSGIVTNASICLRMLAAEPPNVASAGDTVRRTIRDANRASDVITRLRALFGKKGVASDLMDLNEAAEEVIELLSGEVERGRVAVRSEFDRDIPLVRGDRIQLQQVIQNLLRNALDSMSGVDERRRQLCIQTKREDARNLRLTVRDSGVGFSAGDAEKLFDAFYTTKGSGMGIGLSISRSIIESHQGRMWAAPNDGAGATFGFSIPLASTSDESSPGSQPVDLMARREAL